MPGKAYWMIENTAQRQNHAVPRMPLHAINSGVVPLRQGPYRDCSKQDALLLFTWSYYLKVHFKRDLV